MKFSITCDSGKPMWQANMDDRDGLQQSTLEETAAFTAFYTCIMHALSEE
jgi:hypothetical protein